MLNTSIKTEKEELFDTENLFNGNTKDLSSRIVKTTAKTSVVKGKTNELMSNVKVKTLEEIRLEKKKKKKKTMRTAPIQNGGSSIDVKPNISLAKFNIKPLSVRLEPLPNGQHAGKRTFSVNALNNVTIKKEHVDNTEENENTNHEESQLPQQQAQQELSLLVHPTIVPTSPTTRTMQKENTESILKEPQENISNKSFDGVSDTSSSFDWSDIPKSTQDDDTMSLFAYDDIFSDEEPEPVQRQSSQAKKQQNQSDSSDLRNLLKNPTSLANYCNSGTEEPMSETPTQAVQVSRKKEWKKQKKMRNSSTDDCDSATATNDVNEERQREEVQRLQFLHDIVLQNTVIRPGVIPHKTPVTQAQTSSNVSNGLEVQSDTEQHKFAIPVVNTKFRRQYSQNSDRLQQRVPAKTCPVSPMMNMNREFRKQHSHPPSLFDKPFPLNPFRAPAVANNMNFHMNQDFRRQQSEKPNELNQDMQKEVLRIRPTAPGGRGFFEDTPSTMNATIVNKDTCIEGKTTPSMQGPNDKRQHGNRTSCMQGPNNKKQNGNTTSMQGPKDKKQRFIKNKRAKILKRRSADDEIDEDDNTNKQKKPRQIYCNTQLRLGKCSFSFCKLKHMTEKELEEYKMSNQPKHHEQDNEPQTSKVEGMADSGHQTGLFQQRSFHNNDNEASGGSRVQAWSFQQKSAHRSDDEMMDDSGCHTQSFQQRSFHNNDNEAIGGSGVQPLSFRQRSAYRRDDEMMDDSGRHTQSFLQRSFHNNDNEASGGSGVQPLSFQHRSAFRSEDETMVDSGYQTQSFQQRSVNRSDNEMMDDSGHQAQSLQRSVYRNKEEIVGDDAQSFQEELDGSDDDTERMCRGLIGAANQAMDSKKLNEAWQLIQHLNDMYPTCDTSLTTLVERIFALCQDDGVDADIASQVCSKAFDLMATLHGKHSLHDFTQLIGCLCKTGQYIRAYEVFGKMKEAGQKPTYDVFLHLINSSLANPDWAFNLLEEIKEVGLFEESICSALIMLSCKARKPPIERVWSLFKEMMKTSMKPSKEVFLALLDMLTDHNQAKKLLKAINLYDDPTVEPPPKCNKVVVNYAKDNSELVLASITSVLAKSEISEPQLDTETWNALLCNCYSKTFNLCTKAQQIEKLMRKFKVPFLPKGYNALLCSLSNANLTMSVLELYREIIRTDVDLSECKEGLLAAADALTRAKQVEELINIVSELLNNGILPEEKSMMMVIQHLGNAKRYEELYANFQKCRQKNLNLSWVCYKKHRLFLENWTSNPDAALDVYREMRQAYPTPPESEEADEHLYHSSNAAKLIHVPCRYFSSGKCIYGDTCRFSHDKTNLLGDSGNEGLSSVQSTDAFVLKNMPIPPPPPVPTVQVPYTLPMNPMMTPLAGTAFVYQNPSYANFQVPAVNPAYSAYYNAYGMSTTATVLTPTPVIDQEPQHLVIPKSEVQTYKKKIEKATEEESYEELARIYVSMKNDSIPICNEMLEMFYSPFITFTKIGDSFSSFVAIIDIQLDNPDSSELDSRESLDEQDHKFIGELGVALMQFCTSSQRLDEGYLVLHVLHQYSINYFQYPASFVPNEPVLTSSGIALLAADICLSLEKDPQYDGAVEVLRGCNYALPQDGCLLTAEDAEKRCTTIQKITNYYLSNKNYEVVKEFLDNIGDCDTFGMTPLKSIYNELLKGYIDDQNVDEAVSTISHMESKLISRDTNVLRSLVTCLCSIDRFLQAKDIFKSSCLQGAYPVFPQGDGLWHATLWPSFTKFEIQFYLEHHLQLLNKHIEQYRAESQMPYEESHLRPLRISIVQDATDTMSNALTLQMVKEVQERIIDALGSEFNPPLSCGVSDIVGEVLVNPRSLRRWFLANPSYNINGSPKSDDSFTQRNVSTSQGNISVRLDVAKRVDGDQKVSESFSDNKSIMDKTKHTICSHLTRYFRSGVINNRAEFKRHARIIAQDYFRQHELPTEYTKSQRNRVINFVDTHFNQLNKEQDL